jgi:S1-C subfamily serine protease
MQWFYKAADGRVFGPLTTAEFKALAEHGHLTPSTLVKQLGDERWVAASHVYGLIQHQQTAPSGDSEPPPLPQSECADVVTAPPQHHADRIARRLAGVPLAAWLAISALGTVATAAIVLLIVLLNRSDEAQQQRNVVEKQAAESPKTVTVTPTSPPTQFATSAQAAIEKPASTVPPMPPVPHHPEIRDDASPEIHAARYLIDDLAGQFGADTTKWPPDSLALARELKRQVMPWRKHLGETNHPDAEVISRNVSPSVVTIKVVKENSGGTGSGFIARDGGVIVTNFHVIQGAKSAKVVFDDGKTADVDGFLAADPGRDLAVLHVESPNGQLKPLTLASTLPVQGAAVFAFGSPLGLRGSMVDGTVSAIRRGDEVPNHDTNMVWIQTNAYISPGNSGGPLVNADGEVIGVNTFTIVGERQLNFAVSAGDVASVVGASGTVARSLNDLPRSQFDERVTKGDFGNKHARPDEIKGQTFAGRQREAAVIARNILNFYGSVEKMPPRVREAYENAKRTASEAK